ncbi:hypothetical protein ACIA8R_02295 [Nonomuraea sp. NPDC051191]|uniref:hypothetical protein n=1 Tax=Nonomuraea sp. NPDC051191 TaxID=3364372 RepID=UPI00379C3F09
MAMLRLLAIGFLAGVVAFPLLWLERADGFQHARIAALLALGVGQFVTVPVALVGGLVLAARGVWARTPGYLLGTVTTFFGVLVATQAWAMGRWVEGRAEVDDIDTETVLAFLATISGTVTTAVGLSIVLLRWSGYDSRTAPLRQRRARRRG